MGSEVAGPGADAPGPAYGAPAARAWAIAAAEAAARVPVGRAEGDAWTVRGWADVAVGCLALEPGITGSASRREGAFSGLDEVISAVSIVSAGHNAARLRQ